MKINEIKSGVIYAPIEPLEDDVYAYVRAWQGNEVGFSVLDIATTRPDFSNCGVFWVKPEDFVKIFEVYEK